MSATPGQPTEQAFDSAAFLAARNSAEANKNAPKPGPVKEPAKEPEKPVVAAAPPAAPDDDDAKPAHLPRSARREMNRLREQAAAAAARAELLESLIRSGQITPAAAVPKKDPNTEPTREDFKTDAEYAAAVAKHAVRQEVSRTAGESQLVEQLRQQIDEAKSTYGDQHALIPDWNTIQEKASDPEGFPLGDEQIPLQILFATSDVTPHVMEYLVNHPDEWEKLSDLKDDEVAQRAMFHRIEGKVEGVYATRKAAQASKKEPEKAPESKDRNDPAEAQAGRTATSAGKDTRLPKPSSEVAAKGGSTPPLEPKIGSLEWMAQRNAAQYTTRY